MRRREGNGLLGVALLAAALAGCAHRDDAPLGNYVQDAADMKYQRWRMNEVNYFVSDLRCGSGPFEIRLWNQPGAAGDECSLYIYTPRALNGHVAAKFNGGFPDTETQDFHQSGMSYNEACVARPEELAASGSRDQAAGAARSEPAAAPAIAPSVGNAAAAPIVLREVPRPADPPEGSRLLAFGLRFRSTGSVPGARFGDVLFRIWSDEPNDLQGVVFVVGHGVAEFTGPERDFDREKSELVRQRLIEEYRKRDAAPPPPPAPQPLSGPPPPRSTSSEPPPPLRAEPQPPRPSAHAEWIAGYWHWADGDWAWVGGRWRVPPEDVARDLTVHAPSPPPPPRAEPPPPTPSRRLVWTPGYWQWDGRRYVWVAGSWQLPPEVGISWTADRWELRAGGLFVFIPGGWRLQRR